MDSSMEQTKAGSKPSTSRGSSRSSRSIPVLYESFHEPTGSSVIEPDSVLDPGSKRLYHGYKEGKYFMPNDAAEQDRLDLQHHAITLLLGGRLHWVTFKQPPKFVLDVATGTGIWAIRFAQQYPSSHVIGTDLSAIQPEAVPVPNCEFVKEDSEEPWVFPNVPGFDYVHLRFVNTGFDHPKKVMQQAFDNLNPDGWIEYQDDTWVAGSRNEKGDFKQTSLYQFVEGTFKGAATRGRNLRIPVHYKNWMKEIGFVDVHEEVISCPLNGWPDDPRLKQVGKLMVVDMVEGARGIAWKMLQLAGMTNDEIEDLTGRFQRDVADEGNHWFFNFVVIYGRKPRLEEMSGAAKPAN